MNTYGLRHEFQIPIAVRGMVTLCELGILRTIQRRPDGSICAVGIKPLSAVFPHFAGASTLLPTGSDISVTRYRELVDEEQLWICPKEKNYRGVFTAWYPRHALPAGYDVDHALSKALAIHLGYRYVRLTLVERKANRSAGSSGEKLALREGPPPSQLSQLERDPMLYADPSDLAKLFNVPHGNNILAGVAAFHRKNPFIFRP